MAFYYKLTDHQLFYSDVAEDETWIEDTTSDGPNFHNIDADMIAVEPFKNGLAISVSLWNGFRNMASLRSVDLSGIVFSAGTRNRIFYNCPVLQFVRLPQITTMDDGGDNFGWVNCGSADLTLTLTGDCTNTSSLNSLLKNSKWGHIDMSGITWPHDHNLSLWALVQNNTNLKEFIIDDPELRISNTGHAFGGCTSLETIHLPHMSGRTDYTFQNCHKLRTLIIDLMGNIGSSSYHNCSSGAGETGATLKVYSDWTTTTNLQALFEGNDYSVIDLTGITYGEGAVGKNIWHLFQNSSELTTIYANEDIPGNNSSSKQTFSSCPNLVGGNGTVWDSNNTGGAMAVIDLPDRPGYFSAKNITEVEIATGEATYTKVTTDTTDVITIVPDTGYIFTNAMLYQPNGQLYGTYTSSPITVRREVQGIWVLKVYLQVEYNPYNLIPSSDTGGGEGTFDFTSDDINTDTYSDTMQTTNGGLVTVFTPTDQDLDFIKSWLFSVAESPGDIIPLLEGLANKLGNAVGIVHMPDEYIINFYELPIAIPSSDKSSKDFKLGFLSLGRNIAYTNKTLYTVDMGSIEIEELYGNSLDYRAVVQIYLPYIGYKQLDARGVMGKTLNLKYNIDIFTGNCVAQIYVDGNILYQFNGNMAYQLPIGHTNISNQALSAIGNAVGMMSGGTGNFGGAE